MEKLTRDLQEKLKDYLIVLLSLATALAVVLYPLQLHVSLGRSQHYGLSVFILGLGYIVQVVWSWRSLKRWARAGYAATGFYLASIGVVLYANPWLDPRVTVVTSEKENIRALIVWIYTVLGLPLAYIYFEWMRADEAAYRRKGRKD